MNIFSIKPIARSANSFKVLKDGQKIARLHIDGKKHSIVPERGTELSSPDRASIALFASIAPGFLC